MAAAQRRVSPWIALAWAAVVFFGAPYLLATTAWLSAAPPSGVTSEIAFARGAGSPGQTLSLPSDGSSTAVEDLDPEDDDDDDSDSDELSARRRPTPLEPSAAVGASDLCLALAQPPVLGLLLLGSSHLERAPVNKLSQTMLRACSARGPPSA